MSILVIKCINRFSCGLFNACCGMKIKYFAYVLSLNKFRETFWLKAPSGSNLETNFDKLDL